MPSFLEFSFNSSTGENKIYACKCLPEGEPRGVIQIAHGVADYTDRYRDFMEFMAGKGFVVAGNDHLGHGKNITSEADMGFFADEDGWNHVVKDMDTLRDMLRNEYHDLPYILLGHSMGSFLARTYAIKYPNKYDALILSGTGHMSPVITTAGYMLCAAAVKKYGPRKEAKFLNDIAFGSYNKKIEKPKTPFDWVCSDDHVVMNYVLDPLCGFICKASLYRDMVGGIRFITKQKNIDKMNKQSPVYFFAGKEDPVGEYGAGVERAYAAFCKAGLKDVYMKLYPGGRHEMLNEPNRCQVYEDILQWLEMRLHII